MTREKAINDCKQLINMFYDYPNPKTVILKDSDVEILETLLSELENSILKSSIEKKIKELENNKPYLSRFEDWAKPVYTNEDVIIGCIVTLENLLKGE